MKEAAAHLQNHRLTFVTAVEDDGSVVGMLTERDVLRYMTHASDIAFFSGRASIEQPITKYLTEKAAMSSVRHPPKTRHPTNRPPKKHGANVRVCRCR